MRGGHRPAANLRAVLAVALHEKQGVGLLMDYPDKGYRHRVFAVAFFVRARYFPY